MSETGNTMLEHLDHVRTFVAAAESGSFSAAARRAGRAQSVVSTHIALLEADLGVTLFDRSARTPVLTEAGRVLLDEAREVLRQCGQMETLALALCRNPEAELKIALDEGLPYEDISRLCTGFAARFPHLRVQLLQGATLEVQRWVEREDVHLGVAYDQPIADTPGVERRWIGAVDQVLVAAHGHPLSGLAHVRRQDLVSHRQIVIRFALEQGRDPQVLSPSRWEANSSYAAADLVLRGLGWALLPAPIAEYEGVASGLKVLRPELDFPALNIQMLWRSGLPQTPVLGWIMGSLETLWKK